MSRIDEAPTYRAQSLLYVLARLMRAHDQDSFAWIKHRLKTQDNLTLEWRDDNFIAGLANEEVGPYDMDELQYTDVKAHPLFFQTYSDGLASELDPTFYQVLSDDMSSVVTAIRTRFDVDHVVTDCEARHAFLLYLYRHPYAIAKVGNPRTDRWAAIAKSTIVHQLPQTKLSAPSMFAYLDRLNLDVAADPFVSTAWLAAEATESLCLSSITDLSVKIRNPDHRHDIMSDYPDPLDWYDMRDSRAGLSFPRLRIFRLGNVWLIFCKDVKTLYVMDRASINQVRTRAWSLFMMRWYALNYRKCGGAQPDDRSFLDAYCNGESWYFKAIEHAFATGQHPQVVAKAMKTGQARWMNDAWERSEPADFGASARSAVLARDERDIFSCGQPWSEFLASVRLPDHQKLDLSYIFHLAPGTDADIPSLFTDTITRLNDERKQDTGTVEQFFKYTKAMMAMEWVYDCAVHKRRRKDTLKVFEHVEGYEVESQHWFVQTSKKRRTMPPEEDWGKCWIVRAFPYVNKADFWWMSAKDATHINASLAESLSLADRPPDARVCANEIPYCMVYGSKLSRQWPPAEVRRRACQGEAMGDVIAVLAAKSENTKYGAKVRETYSAADTFREIQSEMDHSAQSLADLIKTPSLRKSNYTVGKQMSRIAHNQIKQPGDTRLFVTSSQDVSSWSPRMSRRFAIRFYNLLLSMTQAPAGLDYSVYWNRIDVVMARRGFSAHEPTYTGNFMGFPGTCDSVLHSTMCSFIVNQAKKHGIVSVHDNADVMTTIDDAVMEICFASKDGQGSGYEKMEGFMDFMCDVYAKLGFEVDRVKTIVSSVKFTYLNRVFACGSEALTPMKIFSKCNRELERRFASTSDQMATMFNSLYGASERGADPIFCYLVGTWMAQRLHDKVRVPVKEQNDLIRVFISLAPRGVGGWGVPSLYSWMTKESIDPLSDWFSMINTFCRALSEDAKYEPRVQLMITCATRLAATVSRMEPKGDDPFDVTANVRSFVCADLPNPSAVADSAMREAAKRIARAGEVLAALNMSTDQHFRDAWNEMARSSVIDAAVYEIAYSATPIAVMSGIVTKAQKNEVIAAFISGRQMARLRLVIRRKDRSFFRHLAALWDQVQPAADWDFYEPGHLAAARMRERMYAKVGIEVLNHTEPCPADLLAHVDASPDDNLFASISCDPIHRPYRQPRKTENMYDGRTVKQRHGGVVTKGSIHYNTPAAKASDPMSRSLVKLAMACKWINDNGGTADVLWRLVLKTWSGDLNFYWAELVSASLAGVSSKRLSTTISNVTHPIAAFPNVQGAIAVDLGALGTLLHRGHYRHDAAGLFQLMRTQGLLERALKGKDFEPLRYGVSITSLLPTDPRATHIATTFEGEVAMDAIVPVIRSFPDLDRYLANLRMASSAMVEVAEETEGMDTAAAAEREAEEEERQEVFLSQGLAVDLAMRHRMHHSLAATENVNVIKDALMRPEGITTGISISGEWLDSTADTLRVANRESIEAAVQRHAGGGREAWGLIQVSISAICNDLAIQQLPSSFNASLCPRICEKEAEARLKPFFSKHRVAKAIAAGRNAMARGSVAGKLLIVTELFNKPFALCLVRGVNLYNYLCAWTAICYQLGAANAIPKYLINAARGERKEDLRRKIQASRSNLTHLTFEANPEQWVKETCSVTVREAILAIDPDNATLDVMRDAWREGARMSLVKVATRLRYPLSLADWARRTRMTVVDVTSIKHMSSWMAKFIALTPDDKRCSRMWKEFCQCGHQMLEAYHAREAARGMPANTIAADRPPDPADEMDDDPYGIEAGYSTVVGMALPAGTMPVAETAAPIRRTGDLFGQLGIATPRLFLDMDDPPETEDMDDDAGLTENAKTHEEHLPELRARAMVMIEMGAAGPKATLAENMAWAKGGGPEVAQFVQRNNAQYEREFSFLDLVDIRAAELRDQDGSGTADVRRND